MESSRVAWGLLSRRQCLLPTLRGWFVLALVCAAVTVTGMLGIGPFLAVTDSAPGGVLVVEGWVPDTMLRAAMAEFRRNHYDRLFVTGIPLDQGAPLSEYTNYAFIGAATLVKFGMNTNAVQPVPTGRVRRDRTYAMALSVKDWLRAHGMAPTRLNVMTAGAHARRSRLMFEKAMGKGMTVGVIALPSDDYNERHWWRSSQGFRVVVGETLAYAYARLLFWPPEE